MPATSTVDPITLQPIVIRDPAPVQKLRTLVLYDREGIAVTVNETDQGDFLSRRARKGTEKADAPNEGALLYTKAKPAAQVAKDAGAQAAADAQEAADLAKALAVAQERAKASAAAAKQSQA